MASGTTELISLNALNAGHSLSEHDQPFLANLLSTMRSDDKIAIVVGAGVSIDSGLPSWPALLASMVEQIPVSGPDADLKAGIRSALKAEASDQLRRAENLQTVLLALTATDKEGLVRSALMPSDGGNYAPGELSRSLARMIATDPSRFVVLTTNFDNLLEQAVADLGDSFRSVSLNEATDRLEKGQSPVEAREVVHLHGLITKNNTPPGFGPIVLTESEFLRYGVDVKRVLRETWRECGAVIFVGVSMSDPNLVGPLWDIGNGVQPLDVSDRATPKYVLSVVEDPAPGQDVHFPVAAAISRYRAQFHERLHAQPILLKSYGQLIQAVNELGLAAYRPERYLRKPRKGASLRYGPRFESALTKAYSNAGCTARHEFPKSPDARMALSDALNEIIYGREGFSAALARVLHKEGENPPADEYFGLYLWLRRRSPNKSMAAPYSIVQVGSSSYVQRERWFGPEADSVSFESLRTTGRCVFLGAMQLQNLNEDQVNVRSPLPHVWRGTLARPLIVHGAGLGESLNDEDDGVMDRLTIGAASLTTNFRIFPIDGEKGVPLSGLAVLSSADAMQELSHLLNDRLTRFLFRLT